MMVECTLGSGGKKIALNANQKHNIFFISIVNDSKRFFLYNNI